MNSKTNVMVSAFANVFDDNKQVKIDTQKFMDQFALSKNDKQAKPNFISLSPRYLGRFFVPDDKISEMMKSLNDCYKEGIVNHLYELQDVNDVFASGLIFDFMFESDVEKIEFENVVQGFITILFRDILTKWISFSNEKETHYCFYSITGNPVYDCKTLQFRSYFRIAIPSIMVVKDVRFFIFQRIWRSSKMRNLFDENLRHHLYNCFQRHVRITPTPLIGSCELSLGDEQQTLILDSIHKVIIDKGELKGYPVSVSIDGKFSNVIFDASINHPNMNGTVEKCHYEPTMNCLEKLKAELETENVIFQMMYDEAKTKFMIDCIVDTRLKFAYDATLMLDDRRFGDLESYLEIIRSLAAAGSKCKSIAIMITHERTKNLVTYNEFEHHWNEALNSNYSMVKYSPKSLRFWAASDSPSEMHRYTDDVIRKMIIRDIRDPIIKGRIQHSHIAKYIYFMFGNVYIACNVTKTTIHWYEFVTPLSPDIEDGQLYKWRCLGNQPDSLSEFISNDFFEIATKVYTDLSAFTSPKDKEDKDDPKLKYVKSLFKSFDRAIVSIFNNGFKKAAIEESIASFKKQSFMKQLDKIPHVLGVGNGVLEFNGSATTLLDCYHTYPISLYTTTNYVPYDEDSVYVQTVYKMLRSLVPDNESDALDFLLYYFSTSLDWMPKESLFFIIHGFGSNGKTVLMELFRQTLGDMYVRKMQLSFITDQSRTRSASANPAIMEMKDARLVYYSESDRNEKANVATIKEITGGETISGRQLYKEQENFKVNCNHIVTTNHRFVIESTEHAVWRRFISYKFKICFKHEIDPSVPTERKRDPKLINLIMNDKRYQEAFLSILVHYRSMLYAKYDGQILKVPHPTIINETEEYRQSEDIFQRYIMQRVYYYKDRSQTLDELVSNFRGYYRVENGEQYKAKTADMIHTFNNTIIAKYIKETGGIFTLENFYSCNDHEVPIAGSILFSEWIKQI